MSLFCSQCGAENDEAAITCQRCSEKLARLRPPIVGEIVDDEEDSPNENNNSGFSGNMMFNVLLAVGCAIYIVNPTAGILEFLPDNLPIVGNIDEASATVGLMYALSNLGLNPFSRKK